MQFRLLAACIGFCIYRMSRPLMQIKETLRAYSINGEFGLIAVAIELRCEVVKDDTDTVLKLPRIPRGIMQHGSMRTREIRQSIRMRNFLTLLYAVLSVSPACC